MPDSVSPGWTVYAAVTGVAVAVGGTDVGAAGVAVTAGATTAPPDVAVVAACSGTGDVVQAKAKSRPISANRRNRIGPSIVNQQA